MKKFFEWFDNIEPNKKAEIVIKLIILATAIAKIVLRLVR